MNPEYFGLLFAYQRWARERVLDTAEGTPGEQFAAPAGLTRASLRATLVHIAWAEWLWLQRFEGSSPSLRWQEEEFPTLEDLRDRWRETEERLESFVLLQDEAALQRIVRYTNTKGKEFAFPLWQLLAHVVNHGTNHRSEAAVILTELGRSPGDLDLNAYMGTL